MISFYYTKRHDKLVMSYFPYQNTDWVRRAFKENKEVIISKTFHFRKNDLLTMINEDQEVSYEFIFGKKDNDSFLIEGRILSCSRNLRIRQIPPLLNIDYFKIKHLDKKTSVFQLLDEQINSSIAEITIGDEQSSTSRLRSSPLLAPHLLRLKINADAPEHARASCAPIRRKDMNM